MKRQIGSRAGGLMPMIAKRGSNCWLIASAMTLGSK